MSCKRKLYRSSSQGELPWLDRPRSFEKDVPAVTAGPHKPVLTPPVKKSVAVAKPKPKPVVFEVGYSPGPSEKKPFLPEGFGQFLENCRLCKKSLTDKDLFIYG